MSWQRVDRGERIGKQVASLAPASSRGALRVSSGQLQAFQSNCTTPAVCRAIAGRHAGLHASR